MPIAFDQMNAKTSNYQNNGPLNALVHALVAKQANGQPVIQPDPALQRELSQAFYDEWGTYLSLQQLTNIIEHTTDPMHREMLLGPVLRRMSAADEGEQGDSGSPEVSVEAVAKLGKRFGIRVESYKDYEGIRAEIREQLLKRNPQLTETEDILRSSIDREFYKIIRPEIQAKVIIEVDAIVPALTDKDKDQKIAELVNGELQRMLSGHSPKYPRDPKDDLPEGAGKLAENGVIAATLRLLRKDKGYRFQAINSIDNLDLIITADHNSSQGYKTPCDYAQAAPVLREQLRAAVTTAVAAVPAGDNVDARRQDAIGTAMQNNTSRLFSEYQAGPAKASKTGDAAKGGLNGMMDGLLGNVSDFFSGDFFGSAKGIAGLFQSLFGPIMKMLMGFQETMSESAKQPGDPFSKTEIDKYTAQSEQLGRAATDFSLRVSDLEESSAKVLNEQWRQDPNAIGVWASLIDKLVAEGNIAAANDCLSNQERKLLAKLTAIAASSDDAKKQTIETTIRIYQEATNPLARAMSHPKATDALKHESLMARSHLFQELHISADELSSKHARFTEATTKKGKLEVDKALVDSELATATTAGANTLAARFTAAQTTLTNLLAESAEIIGNNRNFTTQFSLTAEPHDARLGAFGVRGAQEPTTNLGECAAVATKLRVALT